MENKDVILNFKVSQEQAARFAKAVEKAPREHSWRLNNKSRILRRLLVDFCKHIETGGTL